MSNTLNRADRKDITSLTLIALLVLLAFWKIVFEHGYTYFLAADAAGQFYPWYQFAGTSWKSGTPPLWDPFTRGGRPFYDEMQAGAFHPFNVFMFLLPAANGGVDLRTMDLFIVFFTIIGCFGEYSFLRGIGVSREGGIVGGLVYGLAGYSAYIPGHQAIFKGVVWLPWVSLFFLKALESDGWRRVRRAALAGFFLGMTILAGHIQPPAHTCFILGFFALYFFLSGKAPALKRIGAFGALAVTVSFGVLVAAVQLLPSYLYSLKAYRWVAEGQLQPGQPVPFLFHETWSPAESLSLLVPSATSHMLYLGVATLLLAAYGGIVSKNRYRGVMAWLALLSLLYSFGRLSALYAAVYLVLPFAEKVPEASRSFFMFHYAMAALAAFGADALSSPVDSSARKRHRLVSKMLTFVSGGVLLVLIGVGLARGLYVESIKPQSYIPASYAAVLLLITAMLILLREYGLLKLNSFRFAIVGLVAFDLVSFVQSATPLKARDSADAWYKPNPVADFLRSQNGVFRVIDRDGVLPPNFGDVYRIQSISGYGASLGKDFFDFLNSRPDRNDPLRMLNVRYHLTTTPLPGFQLVYKDEKSGASVYEDPRALPRAVLIPKAQLAPNTDLRLAELLLYNTSGLQAGAEARILSYEPQRIRIRATAGQSAYLWLSELTYPGWQATVDGVRQNVLVSDGVFRALDLPAGEHTVEFRFRPGAVLAGLAGTIVGLAALALVSAVGIYRVF
jgi:hypothetical protein